MDSTVFGVFFPAVRVTSRSRSPTVSFPRRSDPAGVTASIGFAERAYMRNQLFGRFFRHIDVETPGGLLVHLDRFQNILFALFAEARQIAQLALARELFHLLHRSRLEGFPEKRDFFRSERLQIQKIEDRSRIFLEELASQGIVAGLENFLNVIGHAVADAGQFHQLGAVRAPALRWIRAVR